MTTTADAYIARVLAALPPNGGLADQIAGELRSTIAERLADGQTLDQALRQLGDPVALAESYLAAVPQVPASIFVRLLIDALFALFTERRQRAFEMLAKTMVVRAGAV